MPSNEQFDMKFLKRISQGQLEICQYASAISDSQRVATKKKRLMDENLFR